MYRKYYYFYKQERDSIIENRFLKTFLNLIRYTSGKVFLDVSLKT